MTYKELLDALMNLSEEQLNMTVTVQDISLDECYGACGFHLDDSGVLDDNHPVIHFVSGSY